MADENVPLPSVDDCGQRVTMWRRSRVRAPAPLTHGVLERAQQEARLLVMFDRDFGELIFARGASGLPGVIFLRFVPQSPTEPAELLVELAASPGMTFVGFFTVMDRDHVRQRPLPVSRPAG